MTNGDIVSVAVAVAQFTAGTDKEVNLGLATGAVASAAAAGAELVVLPESCMYADPSLTPGDFAEKLDGPFVTGLAAAARAAGVTVVAGMTEYLAGAERPSNTVVALGPDGSLSGVYRKIHLYDAFGFRESDLVVAADILPEPLVLDLGGLRFGIMTCYDLRFPEMARYLVDAGATAILLPAAWLAGPAKEEHWRVLVRARAIENTCYLVAAGQTGPFCSAQSMVVDPMGTVLACAGDAPGQALAQLSAERVADVRAANPSLVNRRFRIVPDNIYGR
jgi:predicted amidohydrolase